MGGAGVGVGGGRRGPMRREWASRDLQDQAWVEVELGFRVVRGSRVWDPVRRAREEVREGFVSGTENLGQISCDPAPAKAKRVDGGAGEDTLYSL